MNRTKVKALRRLFNRIAPLNAPQNAAAWRRAKRDYNAQPRTNRAAYLKKVAAEIALAETLVTQS